MYKVVLLYCFNIGLILFLYVKYIVKIKNGYNMLWANTTLNYCFFTSFRITYNFNRKLIINNTLLKKFIKTVLNSIDYQYQTQFEFKSVFV